MTDPLEGLENEPDVINWSGCPSAYECKWSGWTEPGPYWLDADTILTILRTGMYPGFRKMKAA